MSESTSSARKGFFRTMALIVLITAGISAVVFYSLGPIRLGGSPAAANTRAGGNTVDRLIARAEFGSLGRTKRNSPASQRTTRSASGR